MAQITLNIPDIVSDVLDFLDRTFGYEQTQEFAPAEIAVDDEIIVAGCRWHVDAISRCPYFTLPAEYAEYSLGEAWASVWNVDNDRRFALSDCVPVAYLVSLIERNQ